jgi:hypothetical protein
MPKLWYVWNCSYQGLAHPAACNDTHAGLSALLANSFDKEDNDRHKGTGKLKLLGARASSDLSNCLTG